MLSSSLKILDCTLRDGGYYCNWDFDSHLVEKYLTAVSISKIDVVEIGFRMLPKERFLGAYAFSTDDFLESINIPDSIDIAVMVNADELINYDKGIDSVVNRLFKEKHKSRVDIVRIAAHSKDIEQCKLVVELIKGLGYRVFINLMQIDSLDSEELNRIVTLVDSWSTVETFYFADSFGNMQPSAVVEVIDTIKCNWTGDIGFHGHDNKGMAIINSITALKNNIEYIDATILGMGRGAGNTRIENLLVEISQEGVEKYYSDAIFPLVLQEFKILQEKYNWGTNIYYYLSATYGIHPTYIQEMLGGELYNTEQILSTINFLKSSPSLFFSMEKMLQAAYDAPGSVHGEWNAENWAKGRDVIIIASGSQAERHMDAIKKYIYEKNPVVLCLNVNNNIPKDLVTAYVACHETRILIECGLYKSLSKPIILPTSRIPKAIKDTLDGVDILDYGMVINKDDLEINTNGCVLPSSLALFYAISVATSGRADNILLAGVDGYSISDVRHEAVKNYLKKYQKLKESIPITSVTPSLYPIQQRSIYQLEL